VIPRTWIASLAAAGGRHQRTNPERLRRRKGSRQRTNSKRLGKRKCDRLSKCPHRHDCTGAAREVGFTSTLCADNNWNRCAESRSPDKARCERTVCGEGWEAYASASGASFSGDGQGSEGCPQPDEIAAEVAGTVSGAGRAYALPPGSNGEIELEAADG
jgi:hypothetical protein